MTRNCNKQHTLIWFEKEEQHCPLCKAENTISELNRYIAGKNEVLEELGKRNLDIALELDIIRDKFYR